jgi:hypothetical protein
MSAAFSPLNHPISTRADHPSLPLTPDTSLHCASLPQRTLKRNVRTWLLLCAGTLTSTFLLQGNALAQMSLHASDVKPLEQVRMERRQNHFAFQEMQMRPRQEFQEKRKGFQKERTEFKRKKHAMMEERAHFQEKRQKFAQEQASMQVRRIEARESLKQVHAPPQY